jgi:hypothetical protein
VSFVSGGEQFIQFDAASRLAQSRDPVQRATYTVLVTLRRGYQVRDGPTMSRNDDGFALFDLVQKLGKTGLNF